MLTKRQHIHRIVDDFEFWVLVPAVPAVPAAGGVGGVVVGGGGGQIGAGQIRGGQIGGGQIGAGQIGAGVAHGIGGGWHVTAVVFDGKDNTAKFG